MSLVEIAGCGGGIAVENRAHCGNQNNEMMTKATTKSTGLISFLGIYPSISHTKIITRDNLWAQRHLPTIPTCTSHKFGVEEYEVFSFRDTSEPPIAFRSYELRTPTRRKKRSGYMTVNLIMQSCLVIDHDKGESISCIDNGEETTWG